jgi:GNAT superfamily N-acetyltransferase
MNFFILNPDKYGFWQMLCKVSEWNKKTFVFEKLHPKELRWSKKDRDNFFIEDHGLGIWLLVDNDPIAEILWNITMLDPLDEGIEEIDWPAVPYIWSTSVKKEYQGKGYGTLLKQILYNHLRNSGHTEVYGHARQGSSWNITKKLGAEYIGINPNHEGTDETYFYYKQRL